MSAAPGKGRPILGSVEASIVAACLMAIIGMIGAGIGGTLAKDAIIEQCETHQTFTRLGAAGDRTYSCTRIHYYETSL